MNEYKVHLSTHWFNYIINGETEGLNETEIHDINEYMAQFNNPIFSPDTDNDSVLTRDDISGEWSDCWLTTITEMEA